jgi:hypothetical protein
MDVQALLTFLKPFLTDLQMMDLRDYLREKEDIWVCQSCFKQVSNPVVMCHACCVAECGCNNSFRCCGYEPRDSYD